MASDEVIIEVIDVRTDKPKTFLKKESLGSEKQISVDPISLREPSNQQQMVTYPPSTCPTMDVIIPMAPRRITKLVSQSLPNSASSSPRVVPKMPKKTSKKHSHSVSSGVHRDSIALANNLHRLNEIHLHRSKSCGEGRASVPPEDFDHWVTDKPVINVQDKLNDGEYMNHHIKKYNKIGDKDYHVTTVEDGIDTIAEKFKCKALCLYLPTFGKGKPIRARRQSSDVSQAKESETGHVVSKRVSLEKFECASLDSSSLINDDDEDTSNLFFDLPLELIKFSFNDTDSPVTTGFVFDKEPKGVLKKSSAKSTDSSVRQVRFSTSSPTFCVTPTRHSAQDELSAFMEAHST
ncbi:hypothetical protein LIER_25314 [Lithospermum erythrorhizon]|uniref:Uncharacterized protein n=1 Tax=Lithospermum erythrorhizon TaxID=34254 RepID=A0AAV3R4B5_LITER